jgi:hypothetical protein
MGGEKSTGVTTISNTVRLVYYGPPDWLITKFSIEDRRAFGFWVIILACVGALFFGDRVLYVTVLSIVALIPNYTSETPVEIEGGK